MKYLLNKNFKHVIKWNRFQYVNVKRSNLTKE